MGERISIRSGDGFEMTAYRARPEGTPRGGVVVIQEVWGVNSWVRGVADRFAAHGFLAVAPGMFDRQKHGFETDDYGPEERARNAEIVKGFDLQMGLVDLQATIQVAAEGGRVGITGYCFGGRMTWHAAHHGLGLTCGSGYYGGGVPGYIDLKPKIPLEMHYGDADKGIPVEQVEALKARYPEVGIHLYHADHGFCNADRAPTFNAEACTKASARTLAFFRQHLG